MKTRLFPFRTDRIVVPATILLSALVLVVGVKTMATTKDAQVGAIWFVICCLSLGGAIFAIRKTSKK